MPDHDGAVPRVQGALEVRWARAGASARAAITAALLAQQNPIVAGAGAGTDPARSHADSLRDYTWVVETPEASAVLLWANGLFNHHDPSPNEMTHLEGSDLWTLTWRLPASWRASYRISIWSPPQSGGDTPPWRASGDRFAARRAAMAGELDARCKKRIGGANGESSLAEGPLAALGHFAAPELPSSSK
ncbi:MAG: enterochelin esterase domain-containing protein, partial [Ancrocorticia populi]